MTIMDDVARLRSIASSDSFPTGTLQYVQNQVNAITGEVAGVLGPALVSSLGVNVTGGAVVTALQTAVAALEEYKSAINDAADRLAGATG